MRTEIKDKIDGAIKLLQEFVEDPKLSIEIAKTFSKENTTTTYSEKWHSLFYDKEDEIQNYEEVTDAYSQLGIMLTNIAPEWRKLTPKDTFAAIDEAENYIYSRFTEILGEGVLDIE